MAAEQSYAEFSREAGAVMNAPYWRASLIGGDTDAEHIKLTMARMAEKNALYEALEACQSYADLPAKARAIYDRAKATLKVAEEQPT